MSENLPIPQNSVAPKTEEKDSYDFTNLSFSELFRVPVSGMSFHGEPLSGPDLFQLDYSALQHVPVQSHQQDNQKLTPTEKADAGPSNDSFDFTALSFQELMHIPVRVNRWQEGDAVPEPDLDSLSLADLMKLPYHRAFVADLDPKTITALIGEGKAFSDFPSTESGDNNNGGSSSNFSLTYFNPIVTPSDTITSTAGTTHHDDLVINNAPPTPPTFVLPPPTPTPVVENPPPPALSIDDVRVIAGSTAVFTITLTGAIAAPFTVHYSTQNGTATAAEDYTAVNNGSHTFNNLSATAQSFMLSVPIANESVAELVQQFQVMLDPNGTPINISASHLAGIGSISDSTPLPPVADVSLDHEHNPFTVYEGGLSTGSFPNIDPTTIQGNLLANQNFGEIPVSNIDISAISDANQIGMAIYDSVAKTWTLDGSYFNLVVYREDVSGHSKGDFTYTLTGPVTNTSGMNVLDTVHFDLTPIDPNSVVNQETRTASGNLLVNIQDDAPIAHDDANSAVAGGSTITGNLLANDTLGADTPVTLNSITYLTDHTAHATISAGHPGILFDVDGGTLTVYADGDYSYTPPASGRIFPPPYGVSFMYQETDADGSHSSAYFNIDVSYGLQATDDSISTAELSLAPSLSVTTSVSNGNILANDTDHANDPSDTLSVKNIQFTVDNLLINYPELYVLYTNQGATITPNANQYTVEFALPTDHSVLPITMPDGSVLTIQDNGQYHFYQPQNGIDPISPSTDYAWVYSITSPHGEPLSPGSDQANFTISLTPVPLESGSPPPSFDIVETGTGPNQTFTLPLFSSGSESVLVQNFSDIGNNNTIDFVHAGGAPITLNDVMANMSNIHLEGPSPGGGANLAFQVYQTSIVIQSLASVDPAAPPTTPTAVLDLIEQHGHIVLNQ